MSEITVDFWMALSVVPMLIALGIYLWLSRRYDQTAARESLRYIGMVKGSQVPLEGASRQTELEPANRRS